MATDFHLSFLCVCASSVNWAKQLSTPFVDFIPHADSLLSLFGQLEKFASKWLTDEQRSNMCKVERCLNGGQCVINPQKPFGYHCVCVNGYYGYQCQIGWYS
jgi:hypothetical protein